MRGLPCGSPLAAIDLSEESYGLVPVWSRAVDVRRVLELLFDRNNLLYGSEASP